MRNVRVGTGGAVFGIRKVEYGTPFEECFLEMTPMWYTHIKGLSGDEKQTSSSAKNFPFISL